MIPKVHRDQIADELEMVAMEMRHAKHEKDEAHAELWLDSLALRYEELLAEWSADILRREWEQDRIESRKIVDLAAYRG